MRFCPVCDESLEPLRLKGVPLDACPEHGVWLDSGELDTLALRAQGDALDKRHRAVVRAVHRGRCEGERAGEHPLVAILDAVLRGSSRSPLRRAKKRRSRLPPARKVRRDLVLLDPERIYPCPICEDPMRVEALSAFCDTHGMWTAAGALEELLDRIASKILRGLAARVAEARNRGWLESRRSP